MDHEAFVRLILEPIELEESREEPILLVEVLDDTETERAPERRDDDEPWVRLV